MPVLDLVYFRSSRSKPIGSSSVRTGTYPENIPIHPGLEVLEKMSGITTGSNVMKLGKILKSCNNAERGLRAQSVDSIKTTDNNSFYKKIYDRMKAPLSKKATSDQNVLQ